MDTLTENLKGCETSVEKLRELGGAAGALREIAEGADEPDKVIEAAKSEAGTVARHTGEPKDKILSQIDEEVGEMQREAIEKQGGYRVDHGIGLDRYLEEHLKGVVRQRSTDHVDSPVFRWRFDEGEVVETAEGIHFDYYSFFKKVSDSTARRVVPELASEKAKEHADSDEEYAELSLGPLDRPWSRSGDKWARSISGLVEERSSEEIVVGPRTEAWETIRDRISSGRAIRDLDDAVEHGMIYVDDELDEIWVPTSTVANAVENVETSRRALQSELHERGVDSDELSGGKISEAVTRKGVAARFWRLDASHDEVPTPETIVDEVDDPTTRASNQPEENPQPSRGTETFGRRSEADGGTQEGDEE